MWAGAFALVILAVVAPVLQRRDTTAQQFDRWRDVANAFFNYTHDWDDTFPLSMSYDSRRQLWRTGNWAAVPAGSSRVAGRHLEPRRTEESSVGLSAVLPYLNSASSYSEPDLPFRRIPNDYGPWSVARPGINLAINGLLHAFTVQAVARPERTPMVVQHYRQNTFGFQIALPVLCCTARGPSCRFNPSGLPQDGQKECGYWGDSRHGSIWFESVDRDNSSVWVYGHQEVFLSVDGHAELKLLDAPTWPSFARNVNDNPWSSFDSVAPPGAPVWLTDCVHPRGDKRDPDSVYYAGYFRPDNEFEYTTGECQYADD